MRYFDAPTPETQRKPLVPQKLISGMLPGATEIRIGGNENIKISGKDQIISVSDGNTSVSLGREGTTLGFGFTDGTGTKRLHAGVYPDNSVKIKLSQTGKSVLTATDDELIWSSDFNLFKIVDSDTVEGETTDASPDLSIPIPHNLGSVPGAVVFAQPPPNSSWAPFTVFPTFNGGYVPVPLYIYRQINIAGDDVSTILFSITYEVNDTDLILRAHQGVTGLAVSTFPVSFRYYILQETARTA